MIAAIAFAWLLLFAWMRSYRRVIAWLRDARAKELRAVDAPPLPPSPPLVSVLVPARNEEANLDVCLNSLRAQDYPALEIVVVDDRSSDRTGEIARRHAAEDPRVVVVTVEEVAPGWFGKTNALQLGASRASGAWILMTDADTFHAKESVRTGVAVALAGGDGAISLVPRLDYGSWTAHLLYPQISAFFAAVNFRKRAGGDQRPLGASGGWFLVRRDVWDRVGGLSEVKDDVAEDYALALLIHASGAGFRYAGGPTLWSTPSYSTVREMYNGYSRNPNFALGGKIGTAIALVIATWVLALTPLVVFVACALGLLRGGPWYLALGLVPWSAVLYFQASIRRELRTYRWMSLLSPIAAVAGSILIFALFLRARRGTRLSWKGRDYPR
jgi:chlorobactene glucosyltransferase